MPGRSKKMAFGITFLLLILQSLCLGSELPKNNKNCELTTGRALTVIKSVRFPEPYGPNVDCRYTIRRRSDSMCSVTFLFNVLDVEYSPSCSGDYLLFEDTGEKLCGAKPVGFSRTLSFKKHVEDKTVRSNKSEVVMNFHSGNGTRGGRLGYMVTVVQQECPRPSCDVVHEDADFQIKSPNYPLPYDNGQTCAFVVHRSGPTICRLSLTVKHFELEEDEHCDSDYLKLSDSRRLCGTLNEGRIVEVDFTNDTMVLEFQSDHFATRDGFELEAHQVDCVVEEDDDAANHRPPSDQKQNSPIPDARRHSSTMPPISQVLAQTETKANETTWSSSSFSTSSTSPSISTTVPSSSNSSVIA